MSQLNAYAIQDMSRRLVFLAAGVLLSACSSNDDQKASNAGGAAPVEVVENNDPRWVAGRGWTIDAQPVLNIGTEAPGYQFAGIRGAVRLSDGRIVVGDAGSSEVRLFDGQGRLISAAGRPGAGPEEFRRMGKLVRSAGDSVVVFDAATRRVSVLGPNGSFARSLTPAAATLGADLTGVLENGFLVFGVPHPLPPRDGLSRDSVVYFLVSPDGFETDTLLVAPGGQQYQRMNGPRVTRLTIPFGPMAAASASGDRISIGATDCYEIRQYGLDGTATRLIRRQVTPQAFTDAHFRAVTDQFPQLASAFAEIPRPSQAPAFAMMMMDRENNLWVQDYPTPDAPAVSWTVFEPKGAMLGQVPLPANFRPTDIGADYLLGVWTDELGVERVRMYPLRKR